MSASLSCDLTQKRCLPCEGGVPPLSDSEICRLQAQVPLWKRDGIRIGRSFKFEDFKGAMTFVNRVADCAEAEGHHPDLFIHYNEVTITLWTHAVSGLTENDFIVAAKIDAITNQRL